MLLPVQGNLEARHPTFVLLTGYRPALPIVESAAPKQIKS